jgi:hypothetical protein
LWHRAGVFEHRCDACDPVSNSDKHAWLDVISHTSALTKATDSFAHSIPNTFIDIESAFGGVSLGVFCAVVDKFLY